jgi:hypothetical protein
MLCNAFHRECINNLGIVIHYHIHVNLIALLEGINVMEAEECVISLTRSNKLFLSLIDNEELCSTTKKLVIQCQCSTLAPKKRLLVTILSIKVSEAYKQEETIPKLHIAWSLQSCVCKLALPQIRPAPRLSKLLSYVCNDKPSGFFSEIVNTV